MKKVSCILFIPLTIVILLGSCKNSKKDSTYKTEVVPYTLMIKSDLKLLDSTPVAVLQYNLDTLGNGMDTTIITKEEFKKIATVFLEPNIADKDLAKLYKESSYLDEFTKSYNFNYATNEINLPIRNVLVSTSVADNSKFKSVSITKYYKENGSQVNEQLYWKTNAYCLINKTTTTNNITTYSSKKVVWGM